MSGHVEYIPRQPTARRAANLSDILKIANPTIVPTPEPVAPKPQSIQRMAQGLDKPPPNVPLRVVRVGHADVDDLSTWVEGKFEKKWPNVTPAMVAAYGRMALSQNTYGAFRTVEAWGVVDMTRHPFEPTPIARLLFLITRKPVQDEVLALLKQMMQWAKSAGAKEFQVTEFSDYDLTYVLKKLGIEDNFQTHYVRL